ncbi:MAG: response regulator [Myxococcales bacterium]|nr:response regulator [Myxococcales bacterium]
MPESTLHTTRLLAFARELQRASSFRELLDATRKEVAVALGYQHAWLMVAERDDFDEVRLIDASGATRDLLWEQVPVLKMTGDAMLDEIRTTDQPVVVEDARTDPRTDKEMVAKLGNRTIVNIPLRLLDKPFGALGVGTFGDEGCCPPTREQLDYLVAMTSQLTVAVWRIRTTEERARTDREKQEMERRITQIQRLESLGLLAGGIAHDFNNLLTVILSGAMLAQRRVEDERTKGDLAAVLGAAERARELTRQLLAMSRSQELSLVPVDLNARLAQLLRLLQRVLPENIDARLIPSASLPLVQGDASQLDQVFLNLCINARDAMPSGGRLTIETEQVLVNGAFADSHPWAQPGRYVLVTVTDTGIGMSREVLDRAFEPFFTTKGDRVGTGLGLAVAYGVVRQHGGMLHCYSEVGLGTTFKVYLPVHSREASEVGTKLAGAVPTGSERVLVAEDDPAVRAILVRILERAGYHVTAASNGVEAAEVASHGVFELVILDVVMPGPSCSETLEWVKAAQPKARFLLASGYSPDASTSALSESGRHTLLRKPYDPDGLLRAVRRAIDGG